MFFLSRVFKKSSPNGKITVYLGKRDFVDHISHVDPVGKLSLFLVLSAYMKLSRFVILTLNFFQMVSS